MVAAAAAAVAALVAAGALVLAQPGAPAQLAVPTVSGHCTITPTGEPDRTCSPGAVNPRVTPSTLRTTVCQPGWTNTVRPPTAYTNALKLRQLRQYGYADQAPADYEEDHIIPLELGGAPAAVANLWPEPRYGAHPASAKDKVENNLHARVCAGTLPLAVAQQTIAASWVLVWQSIGAP